MVILNTSILFRLLLAQLKPKIVCDVGALDCGDSLTFRKILPDAEIIAFEANPHNYQSTVADTRVNRARIQVVNTAVSDKDGITVFNIEELSDKGVERRRHGTSSMRTKVSRSLGIKTIELPTVRLDTYLMLRKDPQNIALWIDVEGAAYEVLTGITGVNDSVKLVHVEVETKEIWKGQKLKSDVEKLMKSMGFISVARSKQELQQDIVYISEKEFLESPLTFGAVIKKAMVLTYIRKRGGKILGNLVLSLVLSWQRNVCPSS